MFILICSHHKYIHVISLLFMDMCLVDIEEVHVRESLDST